MTEPKRRKPFPGGVDLTAGGYVLFRPDPVGDDTPVCGTCANSGWVGSRTDPEDCPTCGRKPYWLVGDGTYPSPAPVGVPVGDDTPAPTTGRWEVDDKFFVVNDAEDWHVVVLDNDGDHYADGAPIVAAALNRAGAAPDLTADSTAFEVHGLLGPGYSGLTLYAVRGVLAAVAAHICARAAVGDDTPAATAPWTLAEDEATYIDIESAIHQHMGHDGQSDDTNDWVTDLISAIAPFIERAVNSRAGAAPDLTALPTAEQVQEWLRVRSRGLNYLAIVDVLAAVAALVRDTPAEEDDQ